MPHYNPLVCAMLTDMYQVKMAWTDFATGRHEIPSTFDYFFRSAPFKGAFAVFGGLRQAMEFVHDYHFSAEDIAYFKMDPDMAHYTDEFWQWLGQIDCRDVRIYAPPEGTIIFPRTPVLRVEAPLAVGKLLETTLLNQLNYATLVATNAARIRLEAGWEKLIWEFGLRRAQGADGAMGASLYTYLGGFNGTSNCLAGRLFGIPVKGTHAHSHVQGYKDKDLHRERIMVYAKTRHNFDLTAEAIKARNLLQQHQLVPNSKTNDAELAAFLDYGWKNPTNCLLLVDTYSVLRSGLTNFLAVAIALNRAGYRASGLRLDSGDLAYLSQEVRKTYIRVGEFFGLDYFGKMTITESNDLNVDVITKLNLAGNDVDAYGIGTNAVTCEGQPALGGVYKLVDIDGTPRIKLSEDTVKVTIPGQKNVWRLFGEHGAILDLMLSSDEPIPSPGQDVLCCHPFDETKRAIVCPVSVKPLSRLVWDGTNINCSNDYTAMRNYVIEQLKSGQIRSDHLRTLNPTPYKVSLSLKLYQQMHELMVVETSTPRLT